MGEKYRNKSNGLTFAPLENRVAPMVLKLAEGFERHVSGQMGGGGDNKTAVFKLAKQLKKVVEKKQR